MYFKLSSHAKKVNEMVSLFSQQNVKYKVISIAWPPKLVNIFSVPKSFSHRTLITNHFPQVWPKYISPLHNRPTAVYLAIKQI